jgi:hypothetical protein
MYSTCTLDLLSLLTRSFFICNASKVLVLPTGIIKYMCDDSYM